MSLNYRQRRFVDEYLKTGNATQSAIKAGYSEKTATVQASQMLKNLDIQQAINNVRQQLQQNHQIELNTLILYYLKIYKNAVSPYNLDDKSQIALQAVDSIVKLLGFHQALQHQYAQAKVIYRATYSIQQSYEQNSLFECKF